MFFFSLSHPYLSTVSLLPVPSITIPHITKIFSVLSSRSFIVLPFTFRPAIYLQFTLYTYCEVKLKISNWPSSTCHHYAQCHIYHILRDLSPKDSHVRGLVFSVRGGESFKRWGLVDGLTGPSFWLWLPFLPRDLFLNSHMYPP